MSGKECLHLERRFDLGREILKWIAIITMTIDHLGAILFPEHLVLRIIGRLAFPIFCYLIVLGVETTRNVRNYFIRLLLFAFVSQVPYYLALGYEPFASLNIFFTLSFGILFFIHPLLILLSISVSYLLNFDYGPYGIALIASMYVLRKDIRNGIALIVLLNILYFFISEIQPLSLLALPIIISHKNRFIKKEKEADGNNFYPLWRKYFFYIYYPLHLTALYIIKMSFS